MRMCLAARPGCALQNKSPMISIGMSIRTPGALQWSCVLPEVVLLALGCDSLHAPSRVPTTGPHVRLGDFADDVGPRGASRGSRAGRRHLAKVFRGSFSA